MTESLEDLRKGLFDAQLEWREAQGDYFVQIPSIEARRISSALAEMGEFIEGVGVSCGKEDEKLARELLARLDEEPKSTRWWRSHD